MKKLIQLSVSLVILFIASGVEFKQATAAPNAQSNPAGAIPVYIGTASAINNVSGVPAVISAVPGRIVRINVLSASGVGAVYDASTVASGVAAVQVFSIPATVGTYELDWPMKNGIVVNPSSNVLSISYQ